jgi:hypothetical protein
MAIDEFAAFLENEYKGIPLTIQHKGANKIDGC